MVTLRIVFIHEYFDKTWLLYVLRYPIKAMITLCTALSRSWLLYVLRYQVVFKHEYKVIMMYAVLEGQGGEFVLGGYKGHRISVTLYGTRV